MKLCKLSVFFAAVAAVVALGAAAPAQAVEESSCSTHSIPISQWQENPTAHIWSDWDFKCGGANNMDYYVVMTLQYHNSTGWHLASCDGYPNAEPCDKWRPGNAEYPEARFGTSNCSNSDCYNGGSEHTGTADWGLWNDLNFPGTDYRVRADVQFRNGWHVYYYGMDQVV